MQKGELQCIQRITSQNTNKKIASEIIEVTDFIGVKGYKAKGKRISTSEIESYTWLDPLPEPEPEPEPEDKNTDDSKKDNDYFASTTDDGEVIQGTLF